MNEKPITELPEEFESLIRQLKNGNQRYVDGVRRNQDFARQRAELLEGQKPEIIVLTCSDSRIVPHYIFDERIGELFLIRKAGNTVGSISLGSMEFAASHLHSKLLIILGHSLCGAVQAAFGGESNSEFINTVIDAVRPAVNKAKAEAMEGQDIVELATKMNIRLQMLKTFETSKTIRELIIAGKLAMIGAYYELQTGAVEFLPGAYYN